MERDKIMNEAYNNSAVTRNSSGSLRLSPQFKTLLFSILCIFWHFGNFFLLAKDHKELFYCSIFALASVYGIKVWDQWYTKWGYVVMSIIVQLIGLFFCWQYYAGHTDEKLTHWFGLVYAGYMFVIPVVTAGAAFILAAVYEVIAAPLNFIAGRIARAKRIAAQRQAEAEAEPIPSDDGTVVYYGSAEGIPEPPVDTEKTQMFNVYDDTAEYEEPGTTQFSVPMVQEAAAVKVSAEEYEAVDNAPGSAINNMIIDVEIIDDVLPNIVPETENTESEKNEADSDSTVA